MAPARPGATFVGSAQPAPGNSAGVLPALLAGRGIADPVLAVIPTQPSQPPPARTTAPTRGADQAVLPSTTPNASTPTAQIPSTGSLETCIVGSWQVQEYQGVLTTLIPPDILKERVIHFQEPRGKILYTFLADGTVRAEAQEFELTGVMDAGAIDIDLVLRLTGEGTARYQLDNHPGILLLSDTSADQFNLRLSLGGVAILQDIPLQDFIWFGSKSNESHSLVYECQESTLTFTVPPLREGNSPVTVTLFRN